jgi:cobalt-zinc-cadmium efflux system outer membrane protein
MKGLPGLTHKRSGVWAAVWVAALVGVRAQQPAAAPARAAQPDGSLQRLSLADAQLIAFEKNWDLLAAAAGVDAATAQKIVAHEFPNPTLSLYSSLINVDNHPSGTTEGNGLWERSYDTIFAINQLFEIGGKRRNRKASAQAGFEGAKAQLFDARRTLDVAVAKAYVAAAQAEENVRVLLQSAGTLREEARIAEVRFRAGEISSSDKSQIDITAEQFELNAQSAKSAAAQARVTLEVLLGVPNPNAECVLTDPLETLCGATTPINTNSVGTWRPDVMAAEAALRKAEADLRFQKAVRIPDPTLQGQYEHQPPDNPNSVGFMVSLPVPLWNRNRGNILAAEAAREQARLAYEKAKAEAMGDIAVARLAYEDALKRWRSYRESIRPKSEQIRQTMAYAYQKGGASLLDLLVAERNDNDIRLAAAQAASDTASAGAAFKAATQEIQPSQVKQ